MFPGQSNSNTQVIRRMANSFRNFERFPLEEIMDLGIPLMTTGLDDAGYSPQQRELQEWLRRNPKPFKGAPKVIQLAYIAVTAVAESTGSMGIAASSEEIDAYDDSAFDYLGPGGGYGTII